MNDLIDDPPENSQIRDDLPSVEAPTAGFLIQLFVIPAIIVLAVVLVYLLFGKIASGDSDPQQFRVALESSNPVRRWQAAHNLAQTLEADRSLSQNGELASDLVGLLKEELDRGAGANDEQRSLKAYLVTAVGRFQSPVGVPALVRAMKPPYDVAVRFRAISALVDLNDRIEDFPATDVAADLIEVSHDPEPILRKVSAFAMGALDDLRFSPRLQEMLADGDVDVRYNAALALARNGDAASVPVLVAMLDPENTAALDSEAPERRARKTSEILQNALNGANQLVETNETADLGDLRKPLELLSENSAPAVYLKASDVLRKLNGRGKR